MQTSDCRILWRTAAKKIQAFLQGSTRKELLVTGARQVGKTTLIRQLGREAFPNFVELNFLENTAARKLFETASDSSDFLLRLSALAGNCPVSWPLSLWQSIHPLRNSWKFSPLRPIVE